MEGEARHLIEIGGSAPGSVVDPRRFAHWRGGGGRATPIFGDRGGTGSCDALCLFGVVDFVVRSEPHFRRVFGERLNNKAFEIFDQLVFWLQDHG